MKDFKKAANERPEDDTFCQNGWLSLDEWKSYILPFRQLWKGIADVAGSCHDKWLIVFAFKNQLTSSEIIGQIDAWEEKEGRFIKQMRVVK